VAFGDLRKKRILYGAWIQLEFKGGHRPFLDNGAGVLSLRKIADVRPVAELARRNIQQFEKRPLADVDLAGQRIAGW